MLNSNAEKRSLKIKITGANGYLGKLISEGLRYSNHNVSSIDRSLLYGKSRLLQNEIKNCDVIINLAGAPILQRWTTKRKKLIYESRILSTQNLVKAIQTLSTHQQAQKVISASAIGIYKNNVLHDESSLNYAEGFVGNLVQDWEAALDDLPGNIQKNIFRIGLVIGKNAKTIKKLIPIYKLGLGGKIASGKQAFPFIHENDLVRAFQWSVENNTISGIYNLVAPERITNADFTSALAKKLQRPSIFTVPELALKLIYGEAATLLFDSPVVEPKALIDSGFQFTHSTINSALNEIFK